MKKRMPRADLKRKTAFILSLVSIALLLIFGILCFIGKAQLFSAIMEKVSALPVETLKGLTVSEISGMLLNIILAFSVMWIVIAVLTGWTIFLLERKRGRWYFLLILGILVLFSGIVNLVMILPGILLIAAGVLYRK